MLSLALRLFLTKKERKGLVTSITFLVNAYHCILNLRLSIRFQNRSLTCCITETDTKIYVHAQV